jgi:protein-S-isoprenylcysteine O-methyltransferase Ste14
MFANWQSFERSKVYDLLAALPLILFYGWSLSSLWPAMVERFQLVRSDNFTPYLAADTLALFLSVLFSALLIGLLVVRTVPGGKSAGLTPRFAAVTGTFLVIAIVRLPQASPPVWLFNLSVLLIVFGTATSIISLAWLGRSFSIMPEARRLVTKGPYALVRHPLYLFEEITVFGIMLQHVQPWSVLIFTAQFGFQLLRIHYEERVLRENFPGYRDYAAAKWRLIPGVY